MDVVGDDAFIGNAKPAIYGELDRLKRGGCYIGYWTHDMGSNFGVFYMIPFMIIFFATTLVWDTEMPLRHMERYKNYLWTNHILVSLYTTGSEGPFSRNARSTLLLATMIF